MKRDSIIEKITKKIDLDKFYKLIQNKDYESIYNYFGKDAFLFFTPINYKSKDIKKLMQQKKYGEICNKYGSFEFFFIKGFNKLKKEEINNLINAGKFEEIYYKYGEDEYKKHIDKIIDSDMKFEIGTGFSYKIYKTKHKLKSNSQEFIKCLLALSLATNIMMIDVNMHLSKMIESNEIQYASELKQYNKKIEKYAEEVNSLDLTDLQIIMKVMDDTWTDIAGYGEAELNIRGLERLALLEQNSAGVCRHLSDDFTAKMNEINPNYNARNLIVKMDSAYYTNDSLAQIDRKIAESNDEKESIENQSAQNDSSDIDLSSVFGNHMVSLIDIPNENITLAIDVTNPSIGVLKDGKIIMLSTKENKGLEYTPLGQYNYGEFSKYFTINKNYMESYFKNSDIEIINSLYGLDAQNEALNYIRSLKGERSK